MGKTRKSIDYEELAMEERDHVTGAYPLSSSPTRTRSRRRRICILSVLAVAFILFGFGGLGTTTGRETGSAALQSIYDLKSSKESTPLDAGDDFAEVENEKIEFENSDYKSAESSDMKDATYNSIENYTADDGSTELESSEALPSEVDLETSTMLPTGESSLSLADDAMPLAASNSTLPFDATSTFSFTNSTSMTHASVVADPDTPPSLSIDASQYATEA